MELQNDPGISTAVKTWHRVKQGNLGNKDHMWSTASFFPLFPPAVVQVSDSKNTGKKWGGIILKKTAATSSSSPPNISVNFRLQAMKACPGLILWIIKSHFLCFAQKQGEWASMKSNALYSAARYSQSWRSNKYKYNVSWIYSMEHVRHSLKKVPRTIKCWKCCNKLCVSKIGWPIINHPN